MLKAKNGYMYPIDQNLKLSFQKQSNLIDEKLSKPNEAYNANDIKTPFNVPVNSNEFTENIPL